MMQLAMVLRPVCSRVALEGKPWDPWRAARMSMFGMLIQAPGVHWWFGQLDRWFPGRSLGAVFSRIAMDQIFYFPFITSAALSFPTLLAGNAPSDVFKLVQEKLPQIWKHGWMFWVPVHYINFKILPVPYRVAYISSVQFFWGMFLSSQANSIPSSRNSVL